MVMRETTRCGLLLVAAVSIWVLMGTGSAAAGTGLDGWARHTAGRTTDARAAVARIRVLHRIVPAAAAGLRRDGDARAAGRMLDRRLARERSSGLAAYAFQLGYQHELERLWRLAGFDPSMDSDGDGILDVRDHDDDGDGLADARDRTDRGWGIRDAYAVRATPTRYCVWLTDPIPAVNSVAAARRWAGRAADRGCATAVSAAAKPVSLAKLGVTLKAAAVAGTTISLQARATKKPVKLRFSVLKAKTAKTALAKGRAALTVKKAKRFKAVTVALDKAPAGTKLFLAVDAVSGKRKGRGVLTLKVSATAGPPVPTVTPVPTVPAVPAPLGSPPGGGAQPACVANVDTDGDGIADCTEIAGFDYRTFAPATSCGEASCLVPNVVHVSSDPNKANTDDDAVTVDGTTYALSDGQEWADFLNGGLSNPTVADSDGDGLGDVEEVMRWGTNPSTVDSDSDSATSASNVPPNPALYDRAEVTGAGGARAASSPLSRDTDGDGTSDLAEIVAGNRSPAVADVPTLEAVPDSSDALNISIGSSQSDSVALTQSSEQESSKGTEDRNAAALETTSRDLVGVQVSSEFTASLTPSLTIGVSTNYEHEWTSTNTTSREFAISESSRELAQQQYATNLGTVTAETGAVTKGFVIRNTSKLTGLTVKDLRVVAQYICLPTAVGAASRCANPGKRTSLSVPLTPAGEIDLPANSTKQVVLKADGVAAQQLKDLISAPSNVKFYVENVRLFPSGSGQSLSDTIGQSVPSSTASLTIDDGRGNVVDRSVAVNLGRDWGKPDAAQAPPTPLTSVLATMGIPYQLVMRGDFQAIGAINGLATQDITQPGKIPGAWLLFGEGQGIGSVRRFDQVGLDIGDSAGIMYVSDADGDGLFSRDERVLGTSDGDADSDADGLGDFFESQVGWDVGPVNGVPVRRALSDPASSDADSDGLGDAAERTKKTDPRNRDTDADGTNDLLDGDPLNAPSAATERSWSALQLVRSKPGVVTCTDVKCTFPGGGTDGGTLSTPPTGLCGVEPTAPDGCAPNATGYYKATYATSIELDQNANPIPAGAFDVVTGSDVILHAQNESTEYQLTREVFFAVPTTVEGFSLRYTPYGNPGSIASMKVEPISQAAYLGATAQGNPEFAGIAFRADALTGIAQSGALNASPIEAGAVDTQLTLAKPDVTLSTASYKGWNARFRMSVDAKTASKLAAVAVIAGSAEPAAPEATVPGPAGNGLYQDLDYFQFTAGRSPIVQAQVYKHDFLTTGRRSDISLLFSSVASLSNVAFPLRAYAGATGARLSSVTLEPVGRGLDVQRIAGQLTNPAGGFDVARGVAWSALGMAPFATGSHPSAGPDLLCCTPFGASGEAQLVGAERFGMNSSRSFEVDGGYHQWSTHVSQTQLGTCGGGIGVTSTDNSSTSAGTLPALAAGGAGQQLFTPASPSATRTSFGITGSFCPPFTIPPVVVLDRVNLSTRPPGGGTPPVD